MPFLDSLDIANRSCQILGLRKIKSVTEDSLQNNELADAYDRLLDTELQRNIWTFAVKRVALRTVTSTTMLIAPALYNAALLYLPGSIVADANGDYWTSVTPENLGNTPGTSPDWEQYFGPLTADVYDSTVSYYSGELVYKTVGNPGGFVLFMSLVNGNSAVPTTAEAWVATTTYGANDVVSYGGSQWRSLIPINLNVTPADAPVAYQPSVTYSAAQTATGSDGYIYSSIAGGNVGNDPTVDGGVHWTNTNVPAAWSRTPTIYPTSASWAPIFSGMTNLRIYSPIGSGPYYNIQNRNLYHLPSSHLARAPQAPKQGSLPVLGGPTNLAYPDWEFDGDYIVSGQNTPILYRFVAQVRNVQSMHPLFCEGMAARMAMDTANRLTQSAGKWQEAGSKYKLAISDARLKNAIEQGPDEPYEDEYLSVRM